MQVGSPRKLYENPDNVFVAQFIGSPKMNLLPCGAGSGLEAIAAKGAVQLGVRPEHITVVPAGEGHCDGTVQVSEYLGADYFHYIDCGDLGLLTVRTAGSDDEIEGQAVGLRFDTTRLHFFGADEQRI